MSADAVHFVPSFHAGSGARVAGGGLASRPDDVPGEASGEDAGGGPSSSVGVPAGEPDGDGADVDEHAAMSAAEAKAVEERTPSR